MTGLVIHAVLLMLSGDVMLGRGIDQILRHSVDPVLYESYMKSAKGYVDLAEQKSGREGPAAPGQDVAADGADDQDAGPFRIGALGTPSYLLYGSPASALHP